MLREELSRQCYERLADKQMDHKKVIAHWFGEMEKTRMQK
jgi:hypothetical protein